MTDTSTATADGATSGTEGGDNTSAGQTPPEGTNTGAEGTSASVEGTDGQQGEKPAGTEGSKGDDETSGGPKGGAEQLRADLAAERRKRQEAQAELQQLKREGMSDAERQLDEAKQQGAQVGARMLGRAAVIEAAVRAGYADADDAVVYLAEKLPGYVDLATEAVDTDAVTADVTELLARKPHLGAQAKPPAKGGADTADNGGTGGTATPAEQWNSEIRAAAR